MPNLTGKTIGELRAMTPSEIRTAMAALLAPLSRKELIEFDQDATEFADKPEVTTGEHGIISRTQTVRDALGDVVRVESSEYTYYRDGEIHDIIQSVRDAKNVQTAKHRIRHFRDGRQPVREAMAVEAVMEP